MNQTETNGDLSEDMCVSPSASENEGNQRKPQSPLMVSCSSFFSEASSVDTVSVFDNREDNDNTEDNTLTVSFVLDMPRPRVATFEDYVCLEQREVEDILRQYGSRLERLSFLDSLKTPYSPTTCHEQAVDFVTSSFEAIKKPLAAECYQMFNKTLFRGGLHSRRPSVRWVYCGKKIGAFTLPNVYLLASYYADDPYKVANIMLHLMCLAAVCNLEEPCKRETFDQWAILAKSMFPEVIRLKPKQIMILDHDRAIFRMRNVPSISQVSSRLENRLE